LTNPVEKKILEVFSFHLLPGLLHLTTYLKFASK